MESSKSVSPIARKGTYSFLLLLFLTFAANHFFFLGPWWYRSGVFNVADIGNAMIILGVGVLFVFSVDRRIFWNAISALIVLYMGLVVLSIVLASINYPQSLYDGLVGTRHQFYFLSFFLFLSILQGAEEMKKFLDILVVVSIAITILSVINYFGPVIFSHRWAAGHGVRAGAKRAYIPGMEVVAVATLWSFIRWINGSRKSERRKSMGATIFLLAATFFRQTRMRILSMAVVVVAGLIMKKQWKPLFFIAIIYLSCQS